ncbi:hypothetical protein WCX18_02735 [Sulfurimonas sp. HSL1-2]|uniref:hypothetical protein n=1 Tax=Thiomicrolovo zhangzhouensis TaxID=3131933 RepID=UPI0031F9DD4F
MLKLTITFLLLFPSLYAITWDEASKKIANMSFEEYKVYKETDEYKEARKSFTDSAILRMPRIKITSSKDIEKIIPKGKKQKKGAAKKLEYKHLVIDATLKDKNLPDKTDVEPFMDRLLDKAIQEEGQGVDAITIMLMRSDKNQAIASAEWWPLRHKLDPDNQKNIDNKSTYIKRIEVMDEQWSKNIQKKRKKKR